MYVIRRGGCSVNHFRVISVDRNILYVFYWIQSFWEDQHISIAPLFSMGLGNLRMQGRYKVPILGAFRGGVCQNLNPMSRPRNPSD